jgi:hypothetical protein
MSTAGQTLGTRIAAVAGRHASRGRIDDLDQAVAELRAVAANRSDLLADLAGVSQFLVQLAGAAHSVVPALVQVGLVRAEQARTHHHPRPGRRVR